MSEPEQPEQTTPAYVPESRLQRGVRYSHRTGLYLSLAIALATIVFLILLIARNTTPREGRLRLRRHQDWPGLAGHHQRDHRLGPRHRDRLPHPPAHPLAPTRVNEAMYALNFYSPIVAEQLRSGRKTATIRLGDKSAKYRKGMIVQVLAGARFSPRERVFNAVIDKVEVKAPRRPFPSRSRARQPGDPAHGGHGVLPQPALQPRGHARRHGDRDPLQPDPLAAADLRSEQLGITQLRPAGLAVDREDRAERRVARGTAAQHRAAALRALLRNVGLEVVEPATSRAAAETEGHPVAEHLAALLAQPVRRLSHRGDGNPSR